MKKILLFCFIGILLVNNVKGSNWLTSLEVAKKMALASDKLILVDFWATWCGPCKKMDSESWSKEDVKLLMANYIPVKIDIDSNRNIATEYDVKGIPYIFIMDGNGKVVYQQMSYKSKSNVISLLKKYALNTSFLNQDLINYYKNESFATSFRLGSKYQDYCLFIDDGLKGEFLNLAEEYFKVSKKLLKKSDLKNKEAFEQKYQLFQIQEQLILNKPEKALKMLDNIKESSLDNLNKSFFYKLKYITYKQLNSLQDVNAWSEKVTEIDKKKAELFFKSS